MATFFEGEAAGYRPVEFGLYRPYEVKTSFSPKANMVMAAPASDNGGTGDMTDQTDQDLKGGPTCPECRACGVMEIKVADAKGCPTCQADFTKILALGGMVMLGVLGLVYVTRGTSSSKRVGKIIREYERR